MKGTDMSGYYDDCINCGRRLDPSDARGCLDCHGNLSLAAWSSHYDIKPTHPTTETGAVSVLCDSTSNKEAYLDLYHLTDFKVSSVSGVVVWLRPAPVRTS